MITLHSDRLSVEIAEEKEVSGIRFDRTGWIRQVTLDGKYTFCEKEPEGIGHPPTGGEGLCSEIRSAAPVREAKCGEFFHKFGVGKFRKPDEQPYIHYREYECIPYEAEVHRISDNCVRFEIDTGICQGFGLREQKQVTVEDNQIRIEHHLQNIGERDVDIHEYNHNFLSLEGRPAGPGYLLELMPCEEEEKRSGILHYQNGKLTVAEAASKPAMIGISGMRGKFTWKLSHRNSSLSVSETTSFCPDSCGVWVFRQVVSPEVHFLRTLAAQESCQWVRTWTFRKE